MVNIRVIWSHQKVWAADKRLQTNGGSQAITEKLRWLQTIEYHYRDYKVNRGKSNRSCAIQQAASTPQHTTESVKEWNDSDNKVWNLRG